jgi:hypothetical protein
VLDFSHSLRRPKAFITFDINSFDLGFGEDAKNKLDGAA